jgi:hypothetical protein
LVADGHERCKGIALAGAVGLALEESLDQLRRIGNEGFGVLEDRSHGPDCVLAHIGVAVFQTRTRGGKEGLDEFRFAEFAKESKGVSSDIFVGVLKVVANTVTGEPKSVRPK